MYRKIITLIVTTVQRSKMVVQISSISVMKVINVSLDFATFSCLEFMVVYIILEREKERALISIFDVCRPKMHGY